MILSAGDVNYNNFILDKSYTLRSRQSHRKSLNNIIS